MCFLAIEEYAASHILLMCYRLKVGRIYTGRIPAQMIDIKSVLRAIHLKIYPAMSNDGARPRIEITVSVGSYMGRPNPAAAGLIDLRPEPLKWRGIYVCAERIAIPKVFSIVRRTPAEMLCFSTTVIYFTYDILYCS